MRLYQECAEQEQVSAAMVALARNRDPGLHHRHWARRHTQQRWTERFDGKGRAGSVVVLEARFRSLLLVSSAPSRARYLLHDLRDWFSGGPALIMSLGIPLSQNAGRRGTWGP